MPFENGQGLDFLRRNNIDYNILFELTLQDISAYCTYSLIKKKKKTSASPASRGVGWGKGDSKNNRDLSQKWSHLDVTQATHTGDSSLPSLLYKHLACFVLFHTSTIQTSTRKQNLRDDDVIFRWHRSRGNEAPSIMDADSEEELRTGPLSNGSTCHL